MLYDSYLIYLLFIINQTRNNNVLGHNNILDKHTLLYIYKSYRLPAFIYFRIKGIRNPTIVARVSREKSLKISHVIRSRKKTNAQIFWGKNAKILPKKNRREIINHDTINF